MADFGIKLDKIMTGQDCCQDCLKSNLEEQRELFLHSQDYACLKNIENADTAMTYYISKDWYLSSLSLF